MGVLSQEEKNRHTKHTHLPETLALAAMLMFATVMLKINHFKMAPFQHTTTILFDPFHIWDVDVFALLDCQALFTIQVSRPD